MGAPDDRAARPLEPDATERRALLDLMVAHAESFLEALPEAPAWRPIEEALAHRLEPEFPETGRPGAEVFAYLRDRVDRPGVNPASPRFMGYIPGGGLPYSAMADFLAAVTNKYAGFASAGPGAVRIENAVVAWMARVVGYPLGALGTLTSGGSLATLTALIVARDSADEAGGGAVYVTRFAHHCVDKSLHACGRGAAPRRLIDTDSRCRMDPAALELAIERDVEDGVRPWLVIASAGTVDTGAVDPLDDVASVCQRHGAWLHVDGAYGGLFRLCDEGRAVLKGLERADSIGLDPHKTLFLPYGVGAALVRDGQGLRRSFAATAAYLQPLGDADVGPSPADLSLELTRPFRALRLWLPLQLAGVEAFRSAQSEKIQLARELHRRLSALPDFDAGPPPDLSVVTFSYRPATGDADAFNERLLAHLQREGEVFLSGTRVDGRIRLRAAILSFRTHLEHVEALLHALPRAVAAIANH